MLYVKQEVQALGIAAEVPAQLLDGVPIFLTHYYQYACRALCYQGIGVHFFTSYCTVCYGYRYVLTGGIEPPTLGL